MKLRTVHDNQTVTAIFYSLGIEDAIGGHCKRIKLDIFDGWTPSDDTRLSSKEPLLILKLISYNFFTPTR